MNIKFYRDIKVTVILFTFFIALVFGCKEREPDKDVIVEFNNENREINNSGKILEYAVEAPPLSDGIYPCSDCHEFFDPNPLRRELVEWHDDISAIFDHDSENRWCLDCHDLNNRDSLRLANGKLLDFKESYKLCGQCHGEKLRDWKVGVHGKRTGNWNGEKEYLLCVHCHDPHTPKFKEMTPEPPPITQDKIN